MGACAVQQRKRSEQESEVGGLREYSLPEVSPFAQRPLSRA